MTRRNLILLATAGSAALLLGALAFQYIGGLAPCKLCYWQRYPHGAAILVGLLTFSGLSLSFLPLLGALAALATAAVGVYHTGVERDWWEGPTGCTGFDIGGMSPDELMNAINAAPLVRCDEVAWAFAGLSMASWNAVISVALALVWLAAWRRA